MEPADVSTMFDGKNEVRVRSLCVGGDIDTRALRKTRCLSSTPLTLEAGGCGCAVVFRYGAVVFFELEPLEETEFLEGLRPIIQRPASEPVVEEMVLLAEMPLALLSVETVEQE